MTSKLGTRSKLVKIMIIWRQRSKLKGTFAHFPLVSLETCAKRVVGLQRDILVS